MSEVKLFVGNIPRRITSPELKGALSVIGKEILRYFVATDKPDGESKGFGFISVNSCDVDSFLGSEILVDGRPLVVTRAINKEDKDNYVKFFIRNLSFKATKEDLMNIIRPKGFDPVNVVIVMKKEDGTSRGFGFMLVHKIDVNKALSLNGSELRGRPVFLEVYKPRHSYNTNKNNVTEEPEVKENGL